MSCDLPTPVLYRRSRSVLLALGVLALNALLFLGAPGSVLAVTPLQVAGGGLGDIRGEEAASALAGAAEGALEGAAKDTPVGTPRDTLAVLDLDALVVTAGRTPARLATSAASVSVLTSGDLAGIRTRTLAHALEGVTGFQFLDFDGAGVDPQPVLRGFYGGGQAEYVLLLLDGVPLTGLRDGRINWDLVPLVAADRVEVVRGGSSSLWGDAAIGGVVNVITRDDPEPEVRLDLSAGELGTFEGAAFRRGIVGGRAGSAWASLRHTDGFREHAEGSSASVGGSLALSEGPAHSLVLSTLHHARRFDRPGPIPDDALASLPRNAVFPFYEMDEVRDRSHRIGVDGHRTLAAGARLSGHLFAEMEDAEIVRTHALAPDFADTQARDVASRRLLGSFQVDGTAPDALGAGTLTLGTDVSLGRMESEYFGVFMGSRADYLSALPVPRGDRIAKGRGTRTTAAAFGRYEVRPTERLRLGGATRLDWVRDRFDPTLPGEAESASASHLAFSPTLGANLQAWDGGSHETHVYWSVGRSFKAATPDQLFDQRPVPVPFPPYQITVSNADLDPQYGTNYEVGGYHRSHFSDARLHAEASVSAYQMDLEDQVDFDLESFRYLNLGESRHRGVEAALRISHENGSGLFANATVQRAMDRSGEYAGRYLKAIPRHLLTLGVTGRFDSGLSTTLAWNRSGDAYLDDANTRRLDGHSRVDLEASLPVAGMRVAVEARNLLDEEYFSTGFTDPAGTDLVYLHPAAGRTVRVTLGVQW